jgi:DNA-binding MarR family transcriptional regulator
VQDLEADGLVERHPDAADRRRALVQLTAAGRQTLEAERGRREGWLAGAIAGELSGEEQRVLQQAVELLRRLGDR